LTYSFSIFHILTGRNNLNFIKQVFIEMYF